MKFLLKILCLLSLLSSFSFSKDFWVMTDDVLDGLKPMNNCEFFLGRKFLKCTIPETGTYRVFIVNFADDYLYFNPTKSSGYYYNTMYYYFVDKIQYSGYFSYVNKYSYYKYAESDASNGQLFTYTNITEFRINSSFVECSAGDNYGFKSNKCFPACSTGKSWDSENEVCYSDCSDKNLNKFGYSNGTAQGGCVDCSSAFTDHDIASCICSGFGTTLSEKGTYLSLEGSSFVSYSCANGSDITFKRRSNENADKDKDKDNPEPDKDKDKRNDNNSTNSSNKDNPKPDKKDKNENGNKPNGQDSNSSNNNSGGSAGNGSSGGGGTGVETKPNPNYNGNGKEDGKGDGKQDGKGEEGKGDDNIGPAKLDYEGLKASADTFEGQFKTAIDDSFSFVNDVKASLTDTLQKIKDGNLMSLNKGSISSTCPLNYRINLIYFEKDVSFDICKSISPASQTLYYFFYVVFFVLFLVLIIKLFLFTFMGW